MKKLSIAKKVDGKRISLSRETVKALSSPAVLASVQGGVLAATSRTGTCMWQSGCL